MEDAVLRKLSSVKEGILTDQQSATRRKEARYATSFPVQAFGDARVIEGQAKDLSTLGCAIDADELPAQQSYLRLELSLPDGEPPLEIQLAAVRWSHDRLFGVEFIAFGEVQRTRLRKYFASLDASAIKSA